MNNLKNNAFIAHLDSHLDELKSLQSIKSLRTVLSDFLGLNDDLSFRSNTTTLFIDIIQCIEKEDYSIVYSDLEHPCIQNAIKHFYPERKTTCLKLYDLLLKGDIQEIEQRLSKNYNKKSLYIISHVLWNTGISVDIEGITNQIKSNNLGNIVLIDGAQAVGNIKTLFSSEFNSTNIDLYLGCIHKWVNSEYLLGFLSMNTNFSNNYPHVVDKIFIKDIFSIYAGEYKLFKESHNTSSYDIKLLLSITKEVKQLTENFLFNKYTFIDFSKFKVYSIPNIEANTTRFYSIYGDKRELIKVCNEFEIDENFIIEDEKLPKNYSWLRLGV